MALPTMQEAVVPLLAPPCPADVIGADGSPKLGVFRGTPQTVRLEAWASPLARLLRQKRWQYVAVVGSDLIAAVAVAHLGYVGLSFVVVWDRRERRWYEAEALSPLALGIRADGPPADAFFGYQGARGEVTMRSAAGERLVSANFRGDFPGGAEAVQLELELKSPGHAFEPLTCVSKLRPRGLNVTHKAAGLQVRGELRLGTKVLAIEPDRHTALLDWSRGFPPYRTAWNWAIGAGRAAGGARIGFNLCAGFNDAVETENVLWLDGQLHRLGPVEFDVPSVDSKAPWTIRSRDAAVNLRFEPEATRAADENFLLVRSRYREPVGAFTGYLPGPGGTPIEIDAVPGVAEDHLARW
ncbi:MAG: DUF2804 domain-containing protein [Candidatus Wallbacteria bacterium]|nr:DUF2804 domain-containing protein [Candidatus Wallbacteria bacterium]